MKESATHDNRELDSLQAGDYVEAWLDGVLHYEGVVDQVAPHLGVLWIRDSHLHSRLLLDAREYVLFRC